MRFSDCAHFLRNHALIVNCMARFVKLGGGKLREEARCSGGAEDKAPSKGGENYCVRGILINVP